MSGSRCLARVCSSPSPPPFLFSFPFFSSLFLVFAASVLLGLASLRSCKSVCACSFRWGGRACVAWAFGELLASVGLGLRGLWGCWGVRVSLCGCWSPCCLGGGSILPWRLGGPSLGRRGWGLRGQHVLRRRAVANEGMNCAVDLAFVRCTRPDVR